MLLDPQQVLEKRLQNRQAPLSELPAPPRPSAFTTEADHKLLSASPPKRYAHKLFPSAVDRLPGHTSHSYSSSRPGTSLAEEDVLPLHTSRGTPLPAGSLVSRISRRSLGHSRSHSSSPERSAWPPPRRHSALSSEIRDTAAAWAAPKARAQVAAAAAATLGLDPYGDPLPLISPRKGSTALTVHSTSRHTTLGTAPTTDLQHPTAQAWSAASPTLAATQRPGQRKYEQLFHTAKNSRVAEVSNFKKEMEDIDLVR
jgi:hypothetical protein